MNKKVTHITFGIICIIILISCFLLINKYFYNKSRLNQLDFSKIEKMNDSELADLSYKISKGEKFVNKDVMKYKFIDMGANSVEDAIEKTKNVSKYNDNINNVEIKLKEETKYYYVIDISNPGIEKDSYLYLKKSVIDIDNDNINTVFLNNGYNVKEILDIYIYMKNRNNGSIKLLLSEITENPNEYIYTYCYFFTIGGDWGMRDIIEVYKDTILINKQSGNFEYTKNKIREVSGKLN